MISGAANLGHASVVDEDIETAIAASDFLHQHLSARMIAQVGG